MRRALTQARAKGQQSAVVYHLKTEGGTAALSPADTKRLARRAVNRAAARSGKTPKRMNVFENLGSFVVQADPGLLLHLLDEPEIEKATLNRPPGGGMELIRPVRKRPVKSTGWVEV